MKHNKWTCPVKNKNGESPIKANGKLIVIYAGFSKAYRKGLIK